jgi:hypothetical protein
MRVITVNMNHEPDLAGPVLLDHPVPERRAPS